MARRDDERGAVTLTVALTLSVLMGVASFALDLGLQRVGIRDMQALSDVVALDLVREMGYGRTTAEIEADPAWVQAKDRSVARNTDTLGDEPNVEAVLGELDPLTGDFHPSGSTDTPDAVQVTSTSSVKYLLRTGEGAVGRSAVAQVSPQACFRLGSFAANLSSQQSVLLNLLLNDALNTTAVGYNGLSTSDIALGDLAVGLDLGTVEGLVGANVTLGELIDATVYALTRQTGDATAGANITLLQALRGQIAATTSIAIGDILSIGEGADAAAAAELNVLDLIAGAAFVANGAHALSIPSTAINVPNLSSVVVSVSVIEPPKQACGPVGSVAETAQLQVRVTGRLVSVDVQVVGLGLAKVSGDVALTLNVADAKGTLTSVTCGEVTPASPEKITVEVDSDLVELRLSLGAPQLRVNVLGIEVLRLGLTLGTQDDGSVIAVPMVFDDPADFDTPVRVGDQVALDGLAVQVSGVEPLGSLLLDPVLTAVTSTIVNPLVAGLDSTLVKPLTDLLGVTLGGADVWGVENSISCDNPKLRG